MFMDSASKLLCSIIRSSYENLSGGKMITKDEIIKLVGEEQYWLASKAAKNVASPCDSQPASLESTDNRDYVTETAYKINDILAQDDPAAFVDPTPSQLPVILEIYRDIPDYAFLSVCYMHYISGQYSQAAAALLWSNLREFLSSEDEALSGPAEYVLWVDLFENRNSASEAWRRMLAEPRSDLLISRILGNSGPVSCDLKFELYDELLANQHWHADIFESLFASEFDVHGQLDKPTERQRAREILSTLKIEPDSERYTMLSESLAGETRHREPEPADEQAPIDTY